MKNLIYIIAAIFVIGCSDDDEYMVCCNTGTHMDGIEIAVKNENGADLLDPNNPEAYQENNIKLFYKVDGEIVEVYDSTLDSPRNINIYKHENEYRIGINLNYDRNEDQPITYIQWNETDRDTIKAQFHYTGPEDSNYSFTIENLWFNGTEKEPYFEIVK